MYDRRREVLRDRRLRFYECGFQHIYENNKTGQFSLGTPGGVVSVNGDEIQCPNYIDDYNIFFPFQRSLMAALTQNPPGIDFRPDKPNEPEDMEASDVAEGYRTYFDQANDVPEIQMQVARMFCVSSRTIAWTRTEADQQRWGLNDQGEPRRMETTGIYGTLESRLPIMTKEWKDCIFTFLFDDPDVLRAKSEYPDFRKDIKPGFASLVENSYERVARLGILHGTRSQAQVGDSLTHLCTRAHCFLRPAFVESDEFDDTLDEHEEQDVYPAGHDQAGQVINVREQLLRIFPSGCHFVLVGDCYVGSWDESPDDVLTCNFPYDGDGMFRMAMMDPMVVIQDVFNDYMNTEREVWDYGWPSTWVNADDVDFESIADQKADPYAIRQKKARQAMSLADDFFREPDPALPDSFVAARDRLQSLGQFISGAQPALMGRADTKTASEAAQDRTQAMGMLGLPWARIKRIFARIYYQAALAASKNPDHAKEIVIVAPGGANVTLQMDRLSKGKFGAFPDEDSSFPESTEAKRALLQQLVAMAAGSPVGQALFQSPDNWSEFVKLLGFPELTLVEAVARDKQVRELELLLEQTPIPPSPPEIEQFMVQHATQTIAAQAMGGPPPPPLPPMPQLYTVDPATGEQTPNVEGFEQMADLGLLKPSVMPGPLDYDAFEGEEVKEWMSSIDCWRAQAEGKQLNILNVRLHGQIHLSKAAEQAMQAQAMKPPSEAINFKDESPEGQAAMNKQAGINVAPGQAPKPSQTPKNKPPGGGKGQETL